MNLKTLPLPAPTRAVATPRSWQLDFLRGIAILLVLAIHFHLEIPNTPVLGPIFAFFNKIGWVGVDLFFVLSGFLVGGLLITELNKYGTIDPKRFLIRRGFKIYPLYYVFFGYLFAMPLLKTALSGGSLPETFGALWAKYWPNLLFLNGYIGDNPIGHTWTLAIEEHFYLILPFFLLAFSKRLTIKPITLICAALLIPAAVLRSWAVVDAEGTLTNLTATHFRFDALFFGTAIRGFAEVYPKQFTALARFRLPFTLVSFALLLGTAFLCTLNDPFRLTVGYLATPILSATMLVGIFHLSPIKDGIAGASTYAICWIGTYSYAIYLWHVTFFRIFERQVENRLGYSADSPYAMLIWIASAIVITTVTVLVSAAISRIVELPALKVRDRLFPSRSTSMPLKQVTEQPVPT